VNRLEQISLHWSVLQRHRAGLAMAERVYLRAVRVHLAGIWFDLRGILRALLRP
jgi:hypothetical protein